MNNGEGSTKDYSSRRAIDHLNFQAGKAESDSCLLIPSECVHPDKGRLESGLKVIQAFICDETPSPGGYYGNVNAQPTVVVKNFRCQ